jgi:NADPH:quinone reductase
MHAVFMTEPGEPAVLQLQDHPLPIIRHDHQLRVRLKAAGVNPIDTKLRRRGTFYPDRMPAILGCDGAGIIEQVGPSVQRFQPGDAIYFCQGGLGAEAGNYADYIVVDERFVALKPSTLSFAEAAAAPLVLITAWEALYDRGRLQPGQRILIQAGAGGVGHVAIQLAKRRNAQVVTTVSTDEKARLAQRLGADYVVNYKQADVTTSVLEWTNGEGVDLAFDTVGGPVLAQCFSTARRYGDVVTILEPDAATAWKTARTQNLRISLELMLTPMLQGLVTEQQRQAQILEQCAMWIDQGQLQIHVGKTFPLQDAAIAHQLLESGSTMGKIVLMMSD